MSVSGSNEQISASEAASDPYQLHESNIKEPPTSFWQSLKYLGPGFVLSASIVGSGELIATTRFGAEAGFVLMWFIIFSCLVKVAVQLEFGKHAISSGESTMASLNTLPGPRLGFANWSIWIWLILMMAKMLQVGGIVGGVVLALEQFVPTPTAFDLTQFDKNQAISLSINELDFDNEGIASAPQVELAANWTSESLLTALNQVPVRTPTAKEAQPTAPWKLDGDLLAAGDTRIKRFVIHGADGETSKVKPQLAWQRILLAFAVAISVALLVYQGYYILLEKASLVMIGMFTIFTLASLLALQRTDLAISSADFLSGLIPSIPDYGLLLIAIGAFGITGVGGDEIMAYNYWLIEKGYASYTGPKNDSPEWERRAKGWIRIMYWDALLSMLAYTSMTVMFYLLGAAVLHRKGLVPAGEDLIDTLGAMYTESLGPTARLMFVVGAIVVLYSTLFAALAAWTRMFADAFGRVGLYQFENKKSRDRAIGILAWVIPMIWAVLYLYLGDPALMVIIGGTSTVVILLIVVFAALWFRYRRLDQRLLPTKFYDFCLGVSAIAITLVAVLSAKGVVMGIMKALW